MFNSKSLHGDSGTAVKYRQADNYQANYRASYRGGDCKDFSNKFAGKMAEKMGIRKYSDAKFVEMLDGKFGDGEGMQVTRKEYVAGKTYKNGKPHKQTAIIGMELNYAGSKSLSVNGLLFDDTTCIEAHLAGTRAANAFIESNLIHCRMTGLEIAKLHAQGVTVTGAELVDARLNTYRVRADNMMVTEVLHTMARFNAEQTAGGDTQIHSHDTAGTHTFMYGKLRAIGWGEVFENQHLIDAVYKTAQREYLEEHSLAVYDTKDGFELKGFTRNDVEVFSDGRCDRIPRFIDTQNELRKSPGHPQHGDFLSMASVEHREYANMSTRGSKGAFDFKQHAEADVVDVADDSEHGRGSQALGIEAAREWWTYKAANPSGTKRVAVDTNELRLRVEAAQERARVNPVSKRTPEQAYLLAAKHLVQNQSAIKTTNVLLGQMLKFGLYQLSPVTLQDLIDEKLKTGELVMLDKDLCTTKQRLDTEKHTEAMFNTGIEAVRPVTSRVMFEELLIRYQNEKGFELSAGQIAAAWGVLSSTASTSVIIGPAGTGKSTVIELVKRCVEAERRRIFGLAPSGKARDSLLDSIADKEDAPKQEDANYKPHVINSQSAQLSEQWWANNCGTPGTTVVLDEAGLVDANAAELIQGFAAQYKCRLILTGDFNQNHSVGAGTPLQQISELAAAAPKHDAVFHLTEMQRGKVAETKLLHETVFKDPAVALQMMYEMGRLILIDDKDECLAAIAKQYSELAEGAKDNTFVTTNRNETRRELNTAIRAATGIDKQPRLEFDSFERYGGMTSATLMSASSYEPGMTVYFNRTTKPFQKGEACEVLEIDGHIVKLARKISDAQGDRIEHINFDPFTRGESVSLGEEERTKFAVGERVRFTAESKKMGVSNGDRGVVEGIDFETRTATIRVHGKPKPVIVVLPEHGRGLSIRQGYAATGASSQGGTAKDGAEVIKYLPVAHGTSYNEFYTDVTRSVGGPKSVRVYTDARGADAVYALMGKASTKLVYDRAHALSKDALKEVQRAMPELAFSAADGWSNRIKAKPYNEASLIQQLKSARETIGPEIGLHGSVVWGKLVVKAIVDNDLDIKVTNEKLQDYQESVWDAKRAAEPVVATVADEPVVEPVAEAAAAVEAIREAEPKPEPRPRPSPYDEYEYRR